MQTLNAQKICTVLKVFGFVQPEISEDLFLQKEHIIRMGVPPVRIEIATSISGVEFSECYSNKVVDVIDGVEVNVINLGHLKQNKLAAGRYKDLDDLENLP
jgi:hypothetical protein